MVEIDFWRQLLAYLDSSSKLGPEILNILKWLVQNQRMFLRIVSEYCFRQHNFYSTNFVCGQISECSRTLEQTERQQVYSEMYSAIVSRKIVSW